MIAFAKLISSPFQNEFYRVEQIIRDIWIFNEHYYEHKTGQGFARNAFDEATRLHRIVAIVEENLMNSRAYIELVHTLNGNF